ncbi:hypothetical protein LCGC14_0579860 [marine sediment metagenome]|uniref:Uncharacterized protein n=1 Tax=marine sediment metagenome TaxID=412755 RepID=A0A0F9RLR4_9ZZZZ
MENKRKYQVVFEKVVIPACTISVEIDKKSGEPSWDSVVRADTKAREEWATQNEQHIFLRVSEINEIY